MRKMCIYLFMIIAQIASFYMKPVYADENVIGEASATFSNANAGVQESQIGDLTASAMQYVTGSDFAVVYSGNLDWFLLAGEIKESDIEKTVSKDDEVEIVKVTGKQLKNIIENNLSKLTLGTNENINVSGSYSNIFPQIAGFKMKYDVSAPVDNRIIYIQSGSRDIKTDTQQEYTMAIPSNALANAGENDISDSGLSIRSCLRKYITDKKIITPEAESRTEVIGVNVSLVKEQSGIRLLVILILVMMVMLIPLKLRKSNQENEAKMEGLYRKNIWDILFH